MDPFPRPDEHEAAEYYVKYIDQVPSGDIRQVLASQAVDILPLFDGISEEHSGHRYAPDKWSIKQVLSHINDTERLFTMRAMWFARALPEPQPSFDQDVAIANAGADNRTWASHLAEFKAIRSSTLALFDGLPDEAWSRRGVASGHEVTVRALAFIAAGHVAHHARILRERY
ncbi:MAG TPA: DinB family protein [Vicinamibacterales bacterium]|nr:DinB family protein [Vicinamibacterales bacterium]